MKLGLSYSNDIFDLTLEMRDLFFQFVNELSKIGIAIRVTRTACLFKAQFALFAQGRQPLSVVNSYRIIAGLPAITPVENEHKVTWTLKSYHLINLDDQDPNNDFARAFDIVIIDPATTKATYQDIKVHVNDAEIGAYEEAGYIWESLDGVWGGYFPKPDMPHMQEPK